MDTTIKKKITLTRQKDIDYEKQLEQATHLIKNCHVNLPDSKKIDSKQIVIENFIGEGVYGEVHKGYHIVLNKTGNYLY